MNFKTMTKRCLFLNLFAVTIALFPLNIKATSVSPQHAAHLLRGSYSQKYFEHHANTTRSGPYNYVVLHSSAHPKKDTIKVIACRVEFVVDSSVLTTGNGLFGIFRKTIGTSEDKKEYEYYKNVGGKGYIYDDLPHDSLYFKQQLDYVKYYFQKISNGSLVIEHELFPAGKNEENAYKVPQKMLHYSPSIKKPSETIDEFFTRKGLGITKFIRDAIVSIDSSSTSPFKRIKRDTDGFLYEFDPQNPSYKKKVAILVIHAGASYLTDQYQNTGSDLIDLFFNANWFRLVADTVKGVVVDKPNHTAGIIVNKNLPNQFLLDEIMMCSETSNQDSINFGIHGILVNQIARQIGIPDLTSYTTPGVGGFCIMDPNGYSTGRGFIPCWPSAWIRAFMGWDIPKIIEPSHAARIKALAAAGQFDTSIVLVPMNNHEYYLIENRQRNLTTDPTLFQYDTLKELDVENQSLKGSIVIRALDPAHLSKNIAGISGISNCVDSVKNFDIGIPASGLCVWHIDEYIIRDHLKLNSVNIDSAYRAVELMEADGIQDIGIKFVNQLAMSVFEIGTGEDLFPHTTSANPAIISEMGPFTRPATRSHDGAHTFLSISMTPTDLTRKETSFNRGKLVYSFSNLYVNTAVTWDTAHAKTKSRWPMRMIPSKFFDPVLCSVHSSTTNNSDIGVVDSLGRVYLFRTAGASPLSLGQKKELLPTLLFNKDTVYKDTITYLRRVAAPVSFPTTVNKRMYIPCSDGMIHILRFADSSTMVWDSVILSSIPSSYVCAFTHNQWCIGLSNGAMVFGTDTAAKKRNYSVATSFGQPLVACAVIDSTTPLIATINATGTLMIVSKTGVVSSIDMVSRKGESLYSPFTLAVADLDKNDTIDIVVTDNKHGIWLFNYIPPTQKLIVDPEWGPYPNDWAGAFRQDSSRSKIPDNNASVSIADINGDANLEICIGGTNGMYVFNHRGVLLPQWPAILDKKYWYQRGSIRSTPIVATNGADAKPLTIFTTQSGDKMTPYGVGKIIFADKSKNFVVFKKTDGSIDTVKNLTAGFIDTSLTFSDSVVYYFTTPGGFVDAVGFDATRPKFTSTTQLAGPEIQSFWPLGLGGFVSTSPMVCDIDADANVDLIAVSDAGWLYLWQMAPKVMTLPLLWPQPGSSSARDFVYHGPAINPTDGGAFDISYFYNYPNPTEGRNLIGFKYQLTSAAQSVRLDIFTVTGYQVISELSLPRGKGWNEIALPISKLGSAVYRCRLEAVFGASKKIKYWNMAVVK